MSLVVIGRDVKVSWVSNEGDIELIQCEPLTEGQMPRVFNYSKPKQENKWRGGSRGKGGKTKWPRR